MGIEAAMAAVSSTERTEMTTETSSNRPTHRVYAVIIKKEGGAKGASLEIGAAWPHRDGRGYSVMSNRIQLRPPFASNMGLTQF